MKRVRITYSGAFHFAMNRGYDGNDIFAGNKNKAQFLEFLEGTAKKIKIHLLSYCIMDNHYHLVLENTNGRMSDFCTHRTLLRCDPIQKEKIKFNKILCAV